MRLGVFLPNWIGDVVMATPALRALRDHFGVAHILGLLKPYVAGVLEGSPWFDGLLHLDKKGPWSQRWPAVAYRLRVLARLRAGAALSATDAIRVDMSEPFRIAAEFPVTRLLP